MEIETSHKCAIKIFLPFEQNNFLHEVERLIALPTSSPYFLNAIKYVGARNNMPPLIVNGKVFDTYSYIVFPYLKFKDLTNIFIFARN
jgi:hypothetical protein